uniref:Glycine cleavage system H protein n=1 Tax=Albugo laibachii Nc14 TaxID=890382 RepID=F0W022_9STRA|nr:glycine cleavage system H protein putative [Albugo laibachii Nc14]|eukprot:CCA14393.1 glycine cleavage system H protein putative [Albugo laibachii Nc14]
MSLASICRIPNLPHNVLRHRQHVKKFAKCVSAKNLPFGAFFSTYYTPQHEYIKVEGKVGTIGITDFAQNSLGDVVYVELPSVGETFSKGDVFGAVESVKTASDTFTPVTGKVEAINEQLTENSHLVNEDAMNKGWFIKISVDDPTDLEDLMDEASYQKHCENEEH